MQVQFGKPVADSQQGNELRLLNTETPLVFAVHLQHREKSLHLGVLDFRGEGIFRTRRRIEHVYRKRDAWGVCARLLEAFKFRWVSIYSPSEQKEYITSTELIKTLGERLTLPGFETQYMLPRALFGIDKVEQFERRRATQFNLFSVEKV